jgi:predicted nucleic acid-binding Zn ribbon protein
VKTSLTNRVPITPGTCEVCGKPCELEDAACSIPCEAALARREREQGKEIIRLAKLWRKHRGRKGTPGEGALTRIASAVDAMLQADRTNLKKLRTQRELEAHDIGG